MVRQARNAQRDEITTTSSAGLRTFEESVFQETGARWSVANDGIIAVSFGPRRSDDASVIAESQWFADRLSALKDRFPRRVWTTCINLSEVPIDHRPPRTASEIYTHILQDEALVKVAFLHASVVHKAIVAILLAPVIFSDKVHFFSSQEAALDWLRSEHPQANAVNW